MPPVAKWHRDGACDGMVDDDRFFPEEWEQKPHPEIQALCDRCPKNAECLAGALEYEDTDGVWGGTTPYQRRQLKADRNRVRCPGCTSDNVIELGRGQLCLGCGVSWTV